MIWFGAINTGHFLSNHWFSCLFSWKVLWFLLHEIPFQNKTKSGQKFTRNAKNGLNVWSLSKVELLQFVAPKLCDFDPGLEAGSRAIIFNLVISSALILNNICLFECPWNPACILALQFAIANVWCIFKQLHSSFVKYTRSSLNANSLSAIFN